MSDIFTKTLTIGGVEIRGLPPVSSEDNEKVLGVVDGRWEVVDAETFEVTEKSWTRSLDLGDGTTWSPLVAVRDDETITHTLGEVWNIADDMKNVVCTHIETDGTLYVLGTEGDGLYYSLDGITWQQTDIAGGKCTALKFANNTWVAAFEDIALLYSYDGIQWDQCTDDNKLLGVYSLRHQSNYWICCNDLGGWICDESDMNEWSCLFVEDASYDAAINIYTGCYVVLGSSGLYYKPSISADWTLIDGVPAYTSLYYEPEVNDSLMIIYGTEFGFWYSYDGVNWSQVIGNANYFPINFAFYDVYGQYIFGGETSTYGGALCVWYEGEEFAEYLPILLATSYDCTASNNDNLIIATEHGLFEYDYHDISMLESPGDIEFKAIISMDDIMIAGGSGLYYSIATEEISSGDNGKVLTVVDGEWQAEKIPSKPFEYEIVTWADGTDEQISAMVTAADLGLIDLADYWSVGDERSVSLAAMDATGVSESHDAEDVTMVLMNAGGKELVDATTSGRTECSFIVGLKNCLATTGYMNSSNTNSGGWESCARRTWCNSVFRNAIPSTLRGIFKQHKNVTANGTGSTAVTSTDYFALPSEKEIFGSAIRANATAEASNSQFTYYATSSNRIKKLGNSGSANYWWERSPCSDTPYYFCRVSSDGSANFNNASYTYGLAPFGVI